MPDDARSRKNVNATAKAHKARFDVAAVATSVSRFSREADRSATTTTLMGTISRLSPHLLALRAKGWSLPLLAAMVTEDGFPIDSATLGSYLRRLETPKVADCDKAGGRHEVARTDSVETPQTDAPTSPAAPVAPDLRPVDQSAQVAALGVSTANPFTPALPLEPAVSAMSLMPDIGRGNFKTTANRPQRRV